MLIKLHGIIARRFKEELDIPSEIDESFLFEILNMKFDGFKLFIQRQAQEGVFYKMIKEDEDYHVVPVICGNIAAAVTFVTQLGGAFLGNFLTNLAIGGIMNIITPVEEEAYAGAEATVVLQSTRFMGLENKQRAGSKVPIGYGRLRIGSQLVMQYKKPISWSENRKIQTPIGSSVGRELVYLNPTEFTNTITQSSTMSSTY